MFLLLGFQISREITGASDHLAFQSNIALIIIPIVGIGIFLTAYPYARRQYSLLKSKLKEKEKLT